MRTILLKAIVASGSLSISTLCLAASPTQQQIIGWLINPKESSAHPANAINISRSEEILLLSGEKAFISAVEYENAGRNFWAGYILTRPALKQSKILPFGGQSNTFIIHSHYSKGKPVNIIEFTSAGSGQGASQRSKTLTVINGWNIKTLREGEEGSYDGRYDDKLGEIDCKTGFNNHVYFNVMEYDPFIVETTVNIDPCGNGSAKDYKVRTQLFPIGF